MRTVKTFAERSTCNRGKVGAVLTRDSRILSTGYNGAPAGLPHCTDVGCDELILFKENPDKASFHCKGYEEVNLGCQRTVHAEANALLYAARHGIATEGSMMYCTHSPCERCLLLMSSAGVEAFIFAHDYRATPWDLVKELGISWEHKPGYA